MIETNSSGDSVVWQTPDLLLGSHAFSYSSAQYDGLLHTHREYSIVSCLEGGMIVRLGAHDVVLEPGDTFVVNPGVLHRCSFGIGGARSKGLTLLAAPPLLHALCASMGLHADGSETRCLFAEKLRDSELILSATKIVDECSAMRRGCDLIAELLAKQMLVHLLRAWPRDQMGLSREHLGPQLPWLYMHRTTEYMNEKGKGGFRLSELCHQIGLSTSRFIPLFRNSAGMNPHTYYNHLLVFKAQRLLSAEGCSTKEIAYALGFRNVSHFCALFHKLTGVSPQSELHASLPATDYSLGSAGS